jgi:hypothetical protein
MSRTHAISERAMATTTPPAVADAPIKNARRAIDNRGSQQATARYPKYPHAIHSNERTDETIPHRIPLTDA